MVILRYREIEKMSDKEKQNKLKELQMNYDKERGLSRLSPPKKCKFKEIKRTIARLKTSIGNTS